jgi:hypothetical protein
MPSLVEHVRAAQVHKAGNRALSAEAGA